MMRHSYATDRCISPHGSILYIVGQKRWQSTQLFCQLLLIPFLDFDDFWFVIILASLNVFLHARAYLLYRDKDVFIYTLLHIRTLIQDVRMPDTHIVSTKYTWCSLCTKPNSATNPAGQEICSSWPIVWVSAVEGPVWLNCGDTPRVR